jgi:hypothetical protein
MDSLADAALAETDDFVARGHAIITRNLDGATRLAQEYPAVAALLPAIRSALQELFDHLVSVPTLPHADPAAAIAPEPGVAAIDLGPFVGAAHPVTDHAGT